MKTKLLLLILCICNFKAIAQPVIAGDTMLCPNSTGTAMVTNNVVYDSYAWYYKYWFTSDEFELIPNETSDTFTYDWATYDQALIKVVVMLDGQTYESNTIQIDSYAFLPITVGYQDSENISMDPETGNVNLCAGTTFFIEVFQPYSVNIQWYRDGVPIDGANSMMYEVSAAGSYHVRASPGVCPDMVETSEGFPIVVQIDNNCSLSTGNTNQLTFQLYPNPVKSSITIQASSDVEKVSIFNLSGQLVQSEHAAGNTTNIDVSALASGIYFLKVESNYNSTLVKFIKQ